MDELINLINEQADDECLWFIAETAAEDYLQRALRNLHSAVEKSESARKSTAQ